MKQLGLMLLLLVTIGCGNNKNDQPDEEESGFDYEMFSQRYAAASLPYQLSDTSLLKNKDTTRIAAVQFAPLVADSITKKLFGNTAGIRYIPLQRMESKNGEAYFITKAVHGAKTVALLTVFGKDRDTAASFPFLVPDADPSTTQLSTIDNALSVSRNVTRKGKDDVTVEGKDVYAYNAAINGFTLVLTDVLDEGIQELINPIDTLPRKHRFSGDYGRDKKNIVSIRDGRNAAELNVFIHFEKEEGECTGELEGTLLLTSTTTAVYRQGGDPCVLEFTFTPTSVTLREEEGCGAHRGLKCSFDGSYARKDGVKQKATKKKGGKK
jgi:hypothetical protein